MSEHSTDIEWPNLFFDRTAGFPEKMLTLANRRFAGTPDAESAYNFALDQVSADNWARLRNDYRGTGSAAGFLRITFVRLMEEYAVQKYGKRRPPLWIKRLGSLWVRIFELLCLRRLMPETIVDVLTSRGGHEPSQVRDAIVQVRGRVPGCGQYIGEYQSDEQSPTQANAKPDQHQPDAELEETELAELLGSLAGLLADSAEGRPATVAAARERLTLTERRDAVRRKLSLTDTERLILRMIYHEGYTVPKAAKAMRLHEQKVRRTHKSVLQRIHEALSAAGLDAVALGGFVE